MNIDEIQRFLDGSRSGASDPVMRKRFEEGWYVDSENKIAAVVGQAYAPPSDEYALKYVWIQALRGSQPHMDVLASADLPDYFREEIRQHAKDGSEVAQKILVKRMSDWLGATKKKT